MSIRKDKLTVSDRPKRAARTNHWRPQWEISTNTLESIPSITMPSRRQSQPWGNPVKTTPLVRSQVTIPHPREPTPEAFIQTLPLEDSHDQEIQPIATVAAARPSQVGAPMIAAPPREPLLPLLAQVVQNLISLLSD